MGAAMTRFLSLSWVVLGGAMLLATAVGCKCRNEPQPAAGETAAKPRGPISLNGAAATSYLPLHSKWIAEYATVNGNVRINDLPVGSGDGIRPVSAGTVDFWV